MGTKISEFSNGTLPLAGTELVPIVQGGSTVKTTVDAVSAAAGVYLAPTFAGKLSTSGGVISANSSTDALRITQTGAGNALVVEDSVNPDASPFVVAADGKVGIGTTTPGPTLDVLNNSSSLNLSARFGGSTASDNNGIAVWTPTASASAAKLGFFDFRNELNSAVSAVQGDVLTNGGGTIRLATSAAGDRATPIDRLTERVRITETGNVGIGTASPAYALDIQRSSGEAVIRVENTSAANGAWLILKPGASSAAYINNTTAATPTVFITGGSELMRIQSNGNVGIGTGTPGSKLAVIGTASFGSSIATGNEVSTADCNIEVGGNRTGNGSAYVDLHATAGADFEARFGRESGVNGTAQFANTGTGALQIIQIAAAPIIFQTNNTERMRLDGSGSVGLGTSLPGAKLHVTGGANTGIFESASQETALDFKNTGAAGRQWRVGTGSTSGGFANGGFGLYDVTAGTMRMLFDSNGNVGIGIGPSSAGRIDIAGSGTCIRALGSGTQYNGISINQTDASASVSRAAFIDTRNENNIPVTMIGNDIATDGSSNFYLTTTPAGSRTVDRRVERVRVDSVGNVGIGTSTFGTNAARVLALANATAPTTGVAGVGQLYVENGVLKYKGPNGTVTNLGAS